jgi:hypothetical protein
MVEVDQKIQLTNWEAIFMQFNVWQQNFFREGSKLYELGASVCLTLMIQYLEFSLKLDT